MKNFQTLRVQVAGICCIFAVQHTDLMDFLTVNTGLGQLHRILHQLQLLSFPGACLMKFGLVGTHRQMLDYSASNDAAAPRSLILWMAQSGPQTDLSETSGDFSTSSCLACWWKRLFISSFSSHSRETLKMHVSKNDDISISAK